MNRHSFIEHTLIEVVHFIVQRSWTGSTQHIFTYVNKKLWHVVNKKTCDTFLYFCNTEVQLKKHGRQFVSRKKHRQKKKIISSRTNSTNRANSMLFVYGHAPENHAASSFTTPSRGNLVAQIAQIALIARIARFLSHAPSPHTCSLRAFSTHVFPRDNEWNVGTIAQIEH